MKFAPAPAALFRALCCALFLVLLGTESSVALADDSGPPIVNDADRFAASRVAAMNDADPVSRLLMLLEARKLSQAALFALAQQHPDIVEQAIVPRYTRALDWLDSLPPPDLHRLRRGEQVLRSRDLWRGEEEDMAVSIGTSFGFKEKKLLAVRAGPYQGRIFRVIVDSKGKGQNIDRGTIALSWPPTPERNEESRNTLAKYFGARPSALDQGSGSLLPLLDGGFEDPDSLGSAWSLEEAIVLSGVRTPVSDVLIDPDVYLDGTASVRVYNTDATRLFYAISQRVEVVSGMRLTARTHHRTENVRAEFQQNEGDLYLSLSFEDIFHNPVGAPVIARGRISTHTWEPLEVSANVPEEAAYARVAMVSGLSGTTWFDGTSLTLD
ncbi:MAG: hypothetical protein GXP62_21010 [Oligoflexia bacterium]|nr:hypothetical protein [Oligoflexia bacterium]